MAATPAVKIDRVRHPVRRQSAEQSRCDAFRITIGCEAQSHRSARGAPDPAGNMLELIVLHFDDGLDMVIHAIPMRRHYETLLPTQKPMT
jgi:hypothetical protein